MAATIADDRIARNRLEKARKCARWLHDNFLETVSRATDEERQNIAHKSGAKADDPPSDITWAIVVEILRGAK